MSLIKRKAITLLLLAEGDEMENVTRRKKKRYWSKPWYLRRDENSHINLLKEINETNPEDYKNYFRMNNETFIELLSLVKDYIMKQNTVMRVAISPEARLAATLRYLATGRSYEDLKFCTRISPKTLGVIIPETCQAIYEVLKDDYLKMPDSEEEWLKVGEDFENLWNFPNCGGALDGKHIRIVKPAHSGSFYYNYKGYCSVILMALVNANYEFIHVNVGTNGRVSDGGVFENSFFYKKVMEDKMKLPKTERTKRGMNFVFVGDDAFPLCKHLMKPFPQKGLTREQTIFNYRLSRARRIVENVFGILSARFRIFHTEINLKPENIDKVILASCVLHNFLRKKCANSYAPPKLIDYENIDTEEVILGEWRNAPTPFGELQKTNYKNSADIAKATRIEYMEYFNGPGKVSWQEQMIDKGCY